MADRLSFYLTLPAIWQTTHSNTFFLQAWVRVTAGVDELLSLRREPHLGWLELWVEGKKVEGHLDEFPPNWQMEDRINKDWKADRGVNADVQRYLDMPLGWKDYPGEFRCETFGHNGEKLMVMMGSFPDEALFTLFKDGWALGDFDDWPKNWMK